MINLKVGSNLYPVLGLVLPRVLDKPYNQLRMFRGAVSPFPDIFELGNAREKLFATAVNIKSRFSLTVLLLTKRKKAYVFFVSLRLFQNPAEVWETHFSSVRSMGIYHLLINIEM